MDASLVAFGPVIVARHGKAYGLDAGEDGKMNELNAILRDADIAAKYYRLDIDGGPSIDRKRCFDPTFSE
jgi:hypothetical protein